MVQDYFINFTSIISRPWIRMLRNFCWGLQAKSLQHRSMK